jgi:hypothetical protein
VHKNATSLVHLTLLICHNTDLDAVRGTKGPTAWVLCPLALNLLSQFNHLITSPFSLSSFDAMPFGLNTLMNYFGSRKVLSSSNSTHLPNAHRNPRAARRSRSARLHAAKSAARVHNRRSTANAAPNSGKCTSSAGTGAARGANQRGTKYRRAKVRPLTASKPLRRRNTVLVPPAPTHPQPPGAFVVEPSFVVPGYPGLDDRNLPPFVEQKIFFDALDGTRDAPQSRGGANGARLASQIPAPSRAGLEEGAFSMSRSQGEERGVYKVA